MKRRPRLLVLQGTAPALAARLVEFLPMVYCRVLWGASGVSFPTVYYRRSPDGVPHQHELTDDPVWNATLEFARKEVALGRTVDEIRAIAARAAEYRTAAQLLETGSALENIGFTPILMNWPSDGIPDATVKRSSGQKWRPFGFWKRVWGRVCHR